MRTALLIAIIAAWTSAARGVAACPSCPTSRKVSAIVCGEGFGRNIASVLSPFLVLGAIATGLHRIGKEGAHGGRR